MTASREVVFDVGVNAFAFGAVVRQVRRIRDDDPGLQVRDTLEAVVPAPDQRGVNVEPLGSLHADLLRGIQQMPASGKWIEGNGLAASQNELNDLRPQPAIMTSEELSERNFFGHACSWLGPIIRCNRVYGSSPDMQKSRLDDTLKSSAWRKS